MSGAFLQPTDGVRGERAQRGDVQHCEVTPGATTALCGARPRLRSSTLSRETFTQIRAMRFACRNCARMVARDGAA